MNRADHLAILERDRLALLAQMEAEQCIGYSPAPYRLPRRLVGATEDPVVVGRIFRSRKKVARQRAADRRHAVRRDQRAA